jgi:hypothetical protein
VHLDQPALTRLRQGEDCVARLDEDEEGVDSTDPPGGKQEMAISRIWTDLARLDVGFATG